MKRRIVALLIALILFTVFIPTVSNAVITPNYFIAVNDTLLPFGTDNMPYISSGEIFVPDKVLEGLGVYPISSVDWEFIRLYRGVSRYVDFYIASGIIEDQDGKTLYWPSARRVNRRFYVPLRQICDYFSLTYDIIEVPRDIIANEQMWIIRIISNASINNPTFVSLNRNLLRNAYNEYYAPEPTPLPPPPGTTPAPPPPVEPPPNFSDVTIHLSFYGVSEESATGILDLLDIQAAYGYHSCFFVDAGDIRDNPGLIRRISGSGHTIGILLTEGTYEQYLEASALLFEVAKIKTVIVLADEAVLTDRSVTDESELILWESSQSLIDYETQSVETITAAFPQASGARQNLVFSCSENAAAILPGIISYLRETHYIIERITETVTPLRSVQE